MSVEDYYPLAPKEDDVYRPRVEELLGVTMDNTTFEKIAWMIVDEWRDDVMEGPKEHRDYIHKMKMYGNYYIAYLLRDDLSHGSSYPRPSSERLRNVWEAAKTLYSIDDPSGFLGPAPSEMIYVARAIVLAEDFKIEHGFEDELFDKIRDMSWLSDIPKDEAFYEWLRNDGLSSLFSRFKEFHPNETFDTELED